MLILKRLVLWSGETLSETFFLMLFLTALVWRGADKGPVVDTLRLSFFGTLFVFMIGSGYLLTTGIFGVVWRSRLPWVYPIIAATLFIVHVQFFVTGWDASTKVPVQLGGACIVFACCYAGNWCLMKWVQSTASSGSP